MAVLPQAPWTSICPLPILAVEEPARSVCPGKGIRSSAGCFRRCGWAGRSDPGYARSVSRFNPCPRVPDEAEQVRGQVTRPGAARRSRSPSQGPRQRAPGG